MCCDGMRTEVSGGKCMGRRNSKCQVAHKKKRWKFSNFRPCDLIWSVKKTWASFATFSWAPMYIFHQWKVCVSVADTWTPVAQLSKAPWQRVILLRLTRGWQLIPAQKLPSYSHTNIMWQVKIELWFLPP